MPRSRRPWLLQEGNQNQEGGIRTEPWIGDHPHVQANVSSQGGSRGPRSPGHPMMTRHGHEGARNGSGPGRPRKGSQPSPDKTTAAGMRPPWEAGHRPGSGRRGPWPCAGTVMVQPGSFSPGPPGRGHPPCTDPAPALAFVRNGRIDFHAKYAQFCMLNVPRSFAAE